MTPELKPYPFDFKTRTHARPTTASTETHPVVTLEHGENAQRSIDRLDHVAHPITSNVSKKLLTPSETQA